MPGSDEQLDGGDFKDKEGGELRFKGVNVTVSFGASLWKMLGDMARSAKAEDEVTMIYMALGLVHKQLERLANGGIIRAFDAKGEMIDEFDIDDLRRLSGTFSVAKLISSIDEEGDGSESEGSGPEPS